MFTEIGIVSGEILSLLEETRSPVDIKELSIYLNRPESSILLSAGWLIREGMVLGERWEGTLFLSSMPKKKSRIQEIHQKEGYGYHQKKGE